MKCSWLLITKPQYESNMSFPNTRILACMLYTYAGMQSHALSPTAVCMTRTHTITHSFRHKSAWLPSRDDMQKWSKENKNWTVNYSEAKSVEGAIKFAKYIRAPGVEYNVFKYLQATWVKYTQEATEYLLSTETQWGEQSLENWHCVSPNVKPSKQKIKLILIHRLTLKWHLLWIIAGCWPAYIKAVTFHNDLRIWSAEVENSRSDAGQALWGEWGCSAGLGECEKPEDPGYLLLLAAPRTKRGLNTFFLFDCKQWGDLNLLATAMATDFECQPSCGFNDFQSTSKITTQLKI